MNTIQYVVRCTAEGCVDRAIYKIAAAWSDGTLEELKTYSLACESHLASLYRLSCTKNKSCRLAEGETLSTPRLYSIEPGQRDKALKRLADLETKLQDRKNSGPVA